MGYINSTSIPSALVYDIAAMECLHGKSASASTTQNGLFWFCGQKPSCEFFCPEEDCYMFGKAVASFHESGCIHPTCYAHGKLTQIRMVKDKMKESYGRPYFVCSDRTNPCSFWQWADVTESNKPFCRHGLTCRVRKVKKEGFYKDRLFYSCPNEKENSCCYFEWKVVEEEESPLYDFCDVFFSKPPLYRYITRASGEGFNKKAYQDYLSGNTLDNLTKDIESLHPKSVDDLADDVKELNIC